VWHPDSAKSPFFRRDGSPKVTGTIGLDALDGAPGGGYSWGMHLWIVLIVVAFFPTPAGAAGLVEDYEAANGKVQAASAEVARWQQTIETAATDYQRLKAQVELEKAQKRLEQARGGLDKVAARMKPGDALWEKLHTFDPLKVPDMGAAGPVNAAIYQRDQVNPKPSAAPAPGRISYGGPTQRPPQPAKNPGRSWKSRPIAGPRASRPAPARVADPPAPNAAGGRPLNMAPPQVSTPYRDYVGQPIKWNFPELVTHPNQPAEPLPQRVEADLPGVQRALRAGDLPGALRKVEALMAEVPGDPRLLFLQADLLNRMRRFAEAEAAGLQALQMGLDVVELHEAIGWARLHLGKYKLAIASAARALLLDPQSTLGFVIQASAYEQLGDAPRATASLKRAAALSPRFFSTAAQRMQAGGQLFVPGVGGGVQIGAHSSSSGLHAPILLFAALAAAAIVGWAVFLRLK
jgi:tetratricopeptide (TPR) repeat protein